MNVKKYEYRNKLIGYLFLLPSLVFMISFMIYPMFKSVLMSFTNWNGFSPSYDFVGISNYSRIFTQTPEFWKAIGINLQFAFVSTFIQTIMGFLLAFFLYYMTSRWQSFYKVALYLPVIIPASVVAVMWTFIFTPEFGLLNQSLRAVGLGSLTRAWLGETSTALGAIITVNTWQYVGFTMVLYYIAMNNISKDIFESAEIDGANKWDKLVHFFVPLTLNTTEINVILSITGGMKSFALFYLMTGGGPGTATRVVSMLIYSTAFGDYKFAIGLTMSAILFVIILALMLFSRYLIQRNNAE